MCITSIQFKKGKEVIRGEPWRGGKFRDPDSEFQVKAISHLEQTNYHFLR